MKLFRAIIKTIFCSSRPALTIFPLAYCFLAFVYGESSAERLRLLHTNDIHSHILPFVTADGESLGGSARLATLVEQQRQEEDACLLLDAGDAFQGTHFYNFFKGEVEFKVMSAIGYDAMAVGNHELDDGPENLLRQETLHAGFPVLCANIQVPVWMTRQSLNVKNGHRATPGYSPLRSAKHFESAVDSVFGPLGFPYYVTGAGDLRIGLIGVTTETLPIVLARKSLEHLKILPVAGTLRNLVPELRRQVDLIVVLSHCGLVSDSLVAATVPGIDVIVSGHDHRVLMSPRLVRNPANDNGIGGTLLVETGQWGGRLGCLDLEVEAGRILSYDGRLLPVTPALAESPGVTAIVESYRATLELLIAEVIAESPEPLRDDSLLVASSPLGNLVADLMRQATGADVALQNGGGIRGPLPEGQIRIGDLYTLLPFENTIVTARLTGRQMEKLCLEIASMRGSGGFGHVSGLSFRVVDDRVTNARVGAEPLSHSGTYVVATNNFTAAGGDGYKIFKEAGDLTDTGLPVRDAVIGALRKSRVIRPSYETRVRFGAGIDPPPVVPATTQEEIVPDEEEVILTPPPPAEPRINGPRVYGVRPNSPFLYRIPCTGERPIVFSAESLPDGLSLDGETGIITGRVARPGEHHATLVARNAHAETRREFRIVVGDTLALTPPMGWNSWYIHYHRVGEREIRGAADLMVQSGMADYGYQYVNVDDCWMVKLRSNDPVVGGPTRDPEGRILSNRRFPDMKAMADYIHSMGLKAGIYASPGPSTCSVFEGSYKHEALDASTFAEWGFDFLKYDWCSYGKRAGGQALQHVKKPFQVMWAELQKQNRDIIHNVCEYGAFDVWKWGAEVGHSWRTTADLGLLREEGLPGFYDVAFVNALHWDYARPGAWNDPDYILIGWVGDAKKKSEGAKTTLTPSEQYSYMSLWCLMAAPLIYGGDMAKLDPFTLNVLCNHEVIEVDQDPLGKQAKIVRRTPHDFVLVKDMEDGSKTVGLFNLGNSPATLSVSWAELGLSARQTGRDLWRQKDIGLFDDNFSATVPRHGVMLVRLWPSP